MSRSIQVIMLTMAMIVADNFNVANAQNRPEIRLVLQITVDGLRGDLLNRYRTGLARTGSTIC
jgi:hypothetical protein